MLLLQASVVDLASASAGALSARGGLGGAIDGARGAGAGGDGGPGVQIHVEDPAGVLLPPGLALSDLGAPEPHVLLPLDVESSLGSRAGRLAGAKRRARDASDPSALAGAARRIRESRGR